MAPPGARAKTLSGPAHMPNLPYVLIIPEVADYPAWKLAFDAAAGIRKAAGEVR